MNKFRVAQFEYQAWHPLTEFPAIEHPQSPTPSPNPSVPAQESPVQSVPTPQSLQPTPPKDSLKDDAKRLLYNILLKLPLCGSERIQDLDLSGRAFETAKQELITRGFILESTVGKKKYLIPKPEAFVQFSVVCPYKNPDFVEHSFFSHVVASLLKKRASSKSVTLEYKLADSGNTADIVVQREDGSLYAFEITASTGNIIQNCLKYEHTAFKQISFVCRNSDILKAVKSKVLNAGLPLPLLTKLDFVLLSSILNNKQSPSGVKES